MLRHARRSVAIQSISPGAWQTWNDARPSRRPFRTQTITIFGGRPIGKPWRLTTNCSQKSIYKFFSMRILPPRRLPRYVKPSNSSAWTRMSWWIPPDAIVNRGSSSTLDFEPTWPRGRRLPMAFERFCRHRQNHFCAAPYCRSPVPPHHRCYPKRADVWPNITKRIRKSCKTSSGAIFLLGSLIPNLGDRGAPHRAELVLRGGAVLVRPSKILVWPAAVSVGSPGPNARLACNRVEFTRARRRAAR